MRDNGIRLQYSRPTPKADLDRSSLLDILDERCREKTADGGTRMTLNVALNYGPAGAEIVDACRQYRGGLGCWEAGRDRRGDIWVGISTPRGSRILIFLIRTSGEMRISNFLLWQLAYTRDVVDLRRCGRTFAAASCSPRSATFSSAIVDSARSTAPPTSLLLRPPREASHAPPDHFVDRDTGRVGGGVLRAGGPGVRGLFDDLLFGRRRIAADGAAGRPFGAIARPVGGDPPASRSPAFCCCVAAWIRSPHGGCRRP